MTTYWKLVDKLILIAAFWSAVVVAVVTFLRDAWVSNSMTDKTRNFTLTVLRFVDTLSAYLRDELQPNTVALQQGGDTVPVGKPSTKRTKRP